MIVAAVATAILIAAVIVKAWSGLTLMHRYRFEEYLSTPEARRLYWSSKISPLFIGGAILVLAYRTEILWVEVPAWLLLAFIVFAIAWVLRMRFFGKYVWSNRMFSADADLFFTDPRSNMQPPSWFSVLYLLRRDVDLCMGVDPNTGMPTSACQALWPGTMGVLAGVDLLGKFYAGSDANGQVGQRFSDFVDRYFTTTLPDDKETIYQLRNALLHSFGLYSKKGLKEYRFFLSGQGSGPLVTFSAPDRYLIDVHYLHRDFEDAVEKYRVELDSDAGLQVKFGAMFPNYGRVHIG